MVVWIMGVNVNLLKDIVVCWVMVVFDEFYVWFSVIVCCYCYVIYNYVYCLGILNFGVSYYYGELDVEKM